MIGRDQTEHLDFPAFCQNGCCRKLCTGFCVRDLVVLSNSKQ